MIKCKWEDTFGDDLICPYCSYEWDNSWEACSEDSEVIDCPECEMKFWGYMQKSIDYKAKPDCKLNNKEHEFESIDDINSGWQKCKNCGELLADGRKAE